MKLHYTVIGHVYLLFHSAVIGIWNRMVECCHAPKHSITGYATRPQIAHTRIQEAILYFKN